jgi:hypothetical protein
MDWTKEDPMSLHLRQCWCTLVCVGLTIAICVAVNHRDLLAQTDDNYYHDGDLAGSLRTPGPLPVYDADPQHLWNRLFSALYIRESRIASTGGGPVIPRIEGGDYIDFLAWGRTEYWSSEEMARRLHSLLDEFLNDGGADLCRDPLKRVILLRDLWAAYDFLTDQNMRRFGPLETRQRRTALCAKLARSMQRLALSANEIRKLPDTYAAAIQSGQFAERQDFSLNNNFLPPGLLTDPAQWAELDFYQPDLHEDLSDRFITLHARAYRGRSYFRIFCRFPGGRTALAEYLQQLEQRGIDWRQAAQNGFILLKDDAPQIPLGTEVALVQFLMTLDDELKPAPTRIVESIRHRTYRNVDGTDAPETNTGVGMHIQEYTLKRQLLFSNRCGGLQREPDATPLYRVIFLAPDAPDWGPEGRKPLFQQCADCHMSPSANRLGIHSLPSFVHSGGFDAGAQLGIAHVLDPTQGEIHGLRVARWKSRHETYRRLLEQLNR